VACRQLGFLDEAGYQRNNNRSTTFVLFHVNCSGNEDSLFDCEYTTTPEENCTDSVSLRCQCNVCPDLLLEAPQQKDGMTQSTAVFEWRLKHNISTFEILFLSQKNPQTLMYVEDGTVVKGNTRFKHRIQLIDDDYAVVGFNLTNITSADMGIYSLHVPTLLLNSKAVLIVTDFAVVPEPVVHYQVHDRVTLSWDLSALRQLRDISHDIFLTTPATGRLHLDYYYTSWLSDNPHRHVVSDVADHLHPTIIIDDVTVKDAGDYVIEVTLTSSVHQWLNYSWQYETVLVVGIMSSDVSQINAPVAAIVLGVMFGSAIIAIIILLCLYRKRGNKMRNLEAEVKRGNEMVQRQQRPRLPPTNDDERYGDAEENDADYDEANDINIAMPQGPQ